MAVPEPLTREQYLYMAKLAEQAERYQEMVEYMNKLIMNIGLNSTTFKLNVEERNLLSAAYQNVINRLRAAWRCVSSVERTKGGGNHPVRLLAKDYRARIEAEISDVCDTILKLLDDCLIDSADSSEDKVFYLKMKGDYCRYLAEFRVDDELQVVVHNATVAYKAAENIALANLSPVHPTRLGLVLNFSVFYYTILHSSDKAYKMAKLAFDEVVDELNTLNGQPYKETTPIMQLLRDNLTLWASDDKKSDEILI